MLKWLHRDLENSCLANTELWKRINDHPSIPRELPLPNTNSPSAKDMRVAAGLLIFARAIANYVLRLTYLVKDKGIDNVLAELAKQDVNQEVYVRASLLKILLDRQSRGRQEFRSNLESVTGKIASSWSLLQMLEENIKPSFEREFRQDWKPLLAQPITGPVEPAVALTQ